MRRDACSQFKTRLSGRRPHNVPCPSGPAWQVCTVDREVSREAQSKRFSEATSPKTSKEVQDSPHVEVVALKSTKGSQNYVVPDDLAIGRIGL